MYQVHHKESVQTILEKYRIGVLHVDDRISNVEDPYDNEPARHPSAKVLQAKPYFDEIPLSKLADDYYTPNELVYVRNHFPTPDIAAQQAPALSPRRATPRPASTPSQPSKCWIKPQSLLGPSPACRSLRLETAPPAASPSQTAVVPLGRWPQHCARRPNHGLPKRLRVKRPSIYSMFA